MEDHFRSVHTKAGTHNDRKELRKAERAADRSRSNAKKAEKRNEYVKENSSPEKLFLKSEGLEKRLEETVRSLENKIAQMEKLIGTSGKKTSETGVPAKFLPDPKESGLMGRIENLEGRIDQLTNAHNELVKNMDDLVGELREAFSQVSNRINAPHLTWSPGHGMRFERRLN
jgi:chromosome segregation ATPase